MRTSSRHRSSPTILRPTAESSDLACFDLPIAVGVVLGSEQVVADTSRALFLGELSLDGRLRSTHGILPMVSLARERGLREVYVPAPDAAEAALVEGVSIYRSRPSTASSAICAADPLVPASTNPFTLSVSPGPFGRPAVLRDVRVNSHPEVGGWDRIVFEFEGAWPAAEIEYVEQVEACESGERVSMRPGGIRTLFELLGFPRDLLPPPPRHGVADHPSRIRGNDDRLPL